MPPAHCEPPEQTTPHAPQFLSSPFVLTHEPLHAVWPGKQFAAHWPTVQTWPCMHAWPHAPQFAGSFCVLTH
jgi:hypothetical protein